MNDTASQQPAQSTTMAPSVLLMGEIGSGKTHAVHGLVKAGMEVFYLATEPGFEDVLGMIPQDKLKWNYIAPFRDSMSVTMKKAEMIRDFSDKALKEMGGVNKQNHTQILDFMKLCNDFVDLRSGQHFGDVASWGADRCFFLDGLSGLSTMAVKIKIGDKPFMEQNDYYGVQQLLRDTINTLTTNTQCLFVMTSHLEYEPDPITGGQKLMPSTVGQKLAPEISRYFSDAILCKRRVRNGQVEFYWDNIDPLAKVKARNLPWGDNHAADFGPLLTNWRKKAAPTI